MKFLLIFVFCACCLVSIVYCATGSENVRELRSIGDGAENLRTRGVSQTSFHDKSQYDERPQYHFRPNPTTENEKPFPPQYDVRPYRNGGQILGGYRQPHGRPPPPRYGGLPLPPLLHDDSSPLHRRLRHDGGPPHYGGPSPLPHHRGPLTPQHGPPLHQGWRPPRYGGPPPHRGGPSPHPGGPSPHRGPPPYHGGPPPHRGGPPPPFGGPPPHHGGPPPHHGRPPPHHGGPPPHYGGPPPHHGGPPPHYGGPPPRPYDDEPEQSKPPTNGRPHNDDVDTYDKGKETNQYTQNGEQESNNEGQNQNQNNTSSSAKPSTTTTENINDSDSYMLDIRFGDATQKPSKNFIRSLSPFQFQASAVTPEN